MRHIRFVMTGVLILSAFVFASFSQSKTETGQANIIVSTDLGAKTISRHIYGHFSEHLGHCIYGGYWVGDNTGIPNQELFLK